MAPRVPCYRTPAFISQDCASYKSRGQVDGNDLRTRHVNYTHLQRTQAPALAFSKSNVNRRNAVAIGRRAYHGGAIAALEFLVAAHMVPGAYNGQDEACQGCGTQSVDAQKQGWLKSIHKAQPAQG